MRAHCSVDGPRKLLPLIQGGWRSVRYKSCWYCQISELYVDAGRTWKVRGVRVRIESMDIVQALGLLVGVQL